MLTCLLLERESCGLEGRKTWSRLRSLVLPAPASAVGGSWVPRAPLGRCRGEKQGKKWDFAARGVVMCASHLQEISSTAHQLPKRGKINSYDMVEDRLLHVRRLELIPHFPLEQQRKKKQTEVSSQNFAFYYLKLEKAPWVTMIRCKSNTRVLLSFLIAGMK